MLLVKLLECNQKIELDNESLIANKTKKSGIAFVITFLGEV